MAPFLVLLAHLTREYTTISIWLSRCGKKEKTDGVLARPKVGFGGIRVKGRSGYETCYTRSECLGLLPLCGNVLPS